MNAKSDEMVVTDSMVVNEPCLKCGANPGQRCYDDVFGYMPCSLHPVRIESARSKLKVEDGAAIESPAMIAELEKCQCGHTRHSHWWGIDQSDKGCSRCNCSGFFPEVAVAPSPTVEFMLCRHCVSPIKPIYPMHPGEGYVHIGYGDTCDFQYCINGGTFADPKAPTVEGGPCEHEYKAVDAGPYSDDIFYVACRKCGKEKPPAPKAVEPQVDASEKIDYSFRTEFMRHGSRYWRSDKLHGEQLEAERYAKEIIDSGKSRRCRIVELKTYSRTVKQIPDLSPSSAVVKPTDSVISHKEMLEALRNVSHEDLDDLYAGPCPDCGGEQIYDRSAPRAERPLMCVNNCGNGIVKPVKETTRRDGHSALKLDGIGEFTTFDPHPKPEPVVETTDKKFKFGEWWASDEAPSVDGIKSMIEAESYGDIHDSMFGWCESAFFAGMKAKPDPVEEVELTVTFKEWWDTETKPDYFRSMKSIAQEAWIAAKGAK